MSAADNDANANANVSMASPPNKPVPPATTSPTQDLAVIIQELWAEVARLLEDHQRFRVEIGEREKLKIDPPAAYREDREELEGFLLKLRLYIATYVDWFPSDAAKVAFAGSRLEGRSYCCSNRLWLTTWPTPTGYNALSPKRF